MIKLNSFLPIAIIVLALVSACGSAVDQSSISSAGLHLDQDGTQPTDKYEARSIFYLFITLKQPISDAVLRASWVAVETNRMAPNTILKIDEIVPTSSTVVFKLQNKGNFWPPGYYKVYLYQDGREITAIDFEVYHDYFSD